MTTRFALVIISGIAIAAIVGWLFDFKKAPLPQQLLQAPDNIDYYMKQVNYRAFDSRGLLQYHLRTPYLEHFIREDASHLQTPDLEYFADKEQWHARSNTAVLVHADEVLTFRQNVDLRRVQGAQPLELQSEVLILRSREEQMEIPVAMTLKQPGLHLQAQDALLDMKLKRHRFNGVKAVYQDSNNAAG
jgi:LPS export ABC transporter protein LptC